MARPAMRGWRAGAVRTPKADAPEKSPGCLRGRGLGYCYQPNSDWRFTIKRQRLISAEIYASSAFTRLT